MEHKDFLKYLDLVKEPFSIYPAPASPVDENLNLHLRFAKFIYLDDNSTHVKVQDIKTQKTYDVPLVLIEFVNPGVMRLHRPVSPIMARSSNDAPPRRRARPGRVVSDAAACG